jgi:hypothetical protein
MMREKPRKIHVRSNVGVRNPFPLAEAILLRRGITKEPIIWTKLPVETAKSYLYKAFHLNYSRLFDPKFESPLYRGLPRDDKGLDREVRKGNPSPGSGKEFLFSRRTGASPCTANVSDWITNSGWTWPAPPPASSPGTFCFDTMQGCAADCYFIAALSSVAWTIPRLLSGKPDTSNPPNHAYRFYTGVGSPVGRKVARPLGVDANRNLVFARPSDKTGVWGSLYEKAYAIFHGCTPSDRPDITQLNFGNPVTSIMEIIGSNVDARLVASDFSSPEEVFGFVNNKCGGTGGGDRAGCPMVAWTYVDSTKIPGGGAYTDDLILANHSYSLLGSVRIGDQPCIVLRNPFGFSLAEPGAGIHECTWTFTNGSYPIKVSQGNFAIEADAFSRIFEGIGFTV